MPYDVEQIRAQFPALALTDDGQPRVYLDNPAGTQVPLRVLDRIRDYLIHTNANGDGLFRTSIASDQILDEAHQAMADLLNAPDPREIIFGPNMTTLTFALSRALAHEWHPGDELLLTRMDHDANVAPWLRLADDHGFKIRWLPFDTHTYRYDLTNLDNLLTNRTRLAAINYASNALGTINDATRITAQVQAAGALAFVDAVQYVPHRPTDVQAIGCDFLACSAYKFYGPHQGILWGKAEHLERLNAYRVRPAGDKLPVKWETGTQVHECIAGTLGAVEHLAWVGQTMGTSFHAGFAHFDGRRRDAHAGMAAIAAYEEPLAAQLIAGLQALPGLTIHGLTDPAQTRERVPTVSVSHEQRTPQEMARHLAAANIFVWDGDFYAYEVVQRLGLAERGGLLRIGIGQYNTRAEIDQLLNVLDDLL